MELAVIPTVLAKQLKQVAIDQLKQHPRNPRKGNVDRIVESVEANGFFAPLIVQRSSNRILAGNHRYLAAIKAGLSSVPVVFVDVDDAQALKILIADNRTSDVATYDEAALTALLQDITASVDGLYGTAYTESELADLLASVPDFAPASESDQSRLDTRKPITCPNCGHEFTKD